MGNFIFGLKKDKEISPRPFGERVRERGFTLAEVLVTLGVIGVVAAMTLPTVIKNYQQQQTVMKLKRAYNTISNAIQMSKTVNGEVADWDIKFDNTAQSASDFADKYLIPYMKVIKTCKTNQEGDCEPIAKTLDRGYNIWYSKVTSFFTNDGTKFLVGNGFNAGVNKTYYLFIIDINGNKAPNTYGKDIFMFQLYLNNGTLKANFGSSSKETINKYCNKNSEGYSCAAKIINAGWKIEDDYPW